jgi:hypothetical protein
VAEVLHRLFLPQRLLSPPVPGHLHRQPISLARTINKAVSAHHSSINLIVDLKVAERHCENEVVLVEQCRGWRMVQELHVGSHIRAAGGHAGLCSDVKTQGLV